MANKFTWFPKFTRMLISLPNDIKAEMLDAIMLYGTDGIEPNFEGDELKKALFEGFREDIDASINARTKNKGGRPSKTQKENPSKNGGFDSLETTKTGVIDNETGVTSIKTDPNPSYNNKTEQNNTIQDNKKEKDKKEKRKTQNPRFVPPSLDEVQEYLDDYTSEKQVQVDFSADSFCNFYASKGWKVGKDPMKDWRAALRGWITRSKNRASPSNVQAMDNPCPAYGIDPNAKGWGHVYTG